MSAIEDLNEVNIKLSVALEERKRYQAREANGSFANLSPLERRHWQGRQASNERIIDQCVNRINTLQPRVTQELAQRLVIERGRAPAPRPLSATWEAVIAVSHSLSTKAAQ
jgi:hypothetical protein